MVVRQYKARGPVTSTLLPVVAIDDAVCLMLFSILSSVAKSVEAGNGFNVKETLLMPIVEIVGSLVIGFAVGFVLSVATKFFLSRANRISLAVTAVFLGVGLSELLGLSSLLLCMAIGAAMANFSKVSDAVMECTDRWTPPLFMLFFVISGAEFNFEIFKTVGLVGVLYLVLRSAGKYFGAMLGCALVKTEKSVKKYLGITLLPQAGVALGMALKASSELPTDGAIVRNITLFAVLIYEIICPYLTKEVLIKAGDIDPTGRVSDRTNKKIPH
jgi:Kef-type K+ transport system membrane component KefB